MGLESHPSFMHCQNCYTKRDYSGNHAGFGVGAVFVFVGLISLVMRNLGISYFGLASWGYWLFIPAFFIIIGSIAQIGTDKRIREDVASLLKQGGSHTFTIDEISREANVKRHFVLRVLMDLRDLGLINYTYYGASSNFIVGDQCGYQQVAVQQPGCQKNEPIVSQVVQVKYHYCPNCGQAIEDTPDKKYCANCGSLVP